MPTKHVSIPQILKVIFLMFVETNVYMYIALCVLSIDNDLKCNIDMHAPQDTYIYIKLVHSHSHCRSHIQSCV